MARIDFGAGATEAPDIPSYSTPKEGVEKPNVILPALSKLFDVAGGILESNRDAKNKEILAEFSRTQLLVADALDQGQPGMTASYARTLMRKNLLDAIEANPGLADEFIKTQGSLLGIAGGAKNVDEGTEVDQAREARRDQLVREGVISYDASDEEFTEADTTFRIAAEAERNHKERMATIDEKLKNKQLADSERESLQAQKDQATIEFIRSSVPASRQKMKTAFDAILNGAGSAEEKIVAMEDIYNSFLSESTSMIGQVNSDQYTAYLKPFEELKNLYAKRASGEISANALETANQSVIAGQQALLLADPEIARLAAAQKILDLTQLQGALLSNGPAMQKFINIIAGNAPGGEGASPYSTNPTHTKAYEGYTLEVLKGLESEDPAVQANAQEHLAAILSSVNMYAGQLEADPKAGIKFIELMARPEFLEARNKHPELFTNVEAAKSALQRFYGNEVWSMVESEFTKNNILFQTVNPESSAFKPFTPKVLNKSAPTQEYIGVRSSTNGVEFYLLPGIPEDAKRSSEAQLYSINKNLKPIINKTLHAFAHLEGRSDYSKMWEEVSGSFLAGDADQEASELNLEDFNRQSELTANYTGLQGLIDRTESGGDYDALLGFSNREGKTFDGVSISNMTIGEAIEFSSSGGAYAEFSKGVVGRMATPMGRYQIVGKTLKDLVRRMGLPPETPFDQRTQDAMFSVLVQDALKGTSTLAGKRSALRGVWEGFKHASNTELDAAIEHYEEEQ